MNKYFILPLSIFFLLTAGCAVNPVTGKKEFSLLSERQEIAMGQQSDAEIKNYFGVYDDKQLQAFIQRTGEKMAKVSHRPELDYQFKVVDSPVVNAFAVPGGYVYFTRGIMAYFNNEAEFAGVLGHEIGHITARHSAEQYSRSMLAQLGLVAGLVISPELAQFADVAQQGLGLLFLKFSRNNEKESDRLGVEYSTKIGYDAEEMAGFFSTLDRLQAQSGSTTPTFLSTHPDPEDRERRVARLAEKWQKDLGVEVETDRSSYLKMIDGMIYGEDPKQGYLENGIFYHPVLKFRFPVPAGWTFQNTPQQVQMAPRDGGAILTLRLVGGNSLQEAARQLLEQNQLKLVESKETQVNGLPALALVADQQQQQQQQQSVRTLTYLIQHNGNIYSLMGASLAENFSQFDDVFARSMTNFAELKDPSKINVKPEKIKIREVSNAMTLAQAFKKFGVPQERMEELAILNGMYLDDRLEAGTLLKLIERS